MGEFWAEPSVALRTCLTFLVVVAPIYLVFRYFVKLVRQAYGFEAPPQDDGPPLRVCGSCHNTVLEADFSHCPYCGAPLPPAQGNDLEREGESVAPP
jgi:uncharacterized paraquat-inducible protein A